MTNDIEIDDKKAPALAFPLYFRFAVLQASVLKDGSNKLKENILLLLLLLGCIISDRGARVSALLMKDDIDQT